MKNHTPKPGKGADIARTPPKPIPLPVIPENIPATLKERVQWVNWKYEWRPDKKGGGKWTKPLFDPNADRRYGKTNDPSTWGDFNAAFGRYRAGEFDGIGFVLHEDDGLAGVDLDHVVDPQTGEVFPWALQIIQRFEGTYTECSPSGEGARIFCFGRATKSGKGAANKLIELYDHGSPRYLTVTGQLWPGSYPGITEQQAALDWLHVQHFASQSMLTASKPKPNGAYLPVGDDAGLLEKALQAKNGHRLRALLSGDFSGYPSQSEADAAACSILAFWTQDPAQIDRIIRDSGLMREKWDRRHRADGATHGEMTIELALAGLTATYSGHMRGRTPPSPSVATPSPDGLDLDEAMRLLAFCHRTGRTAPPMEWKPEHRTPFVHSGRPTFTAPFAQTFAEHGAKGFIDAIESGYVPKRMEKVERESVGGNDVSGETIMREARHFLDEITGMEVSEQEGLALVRKAEAWPDPQPLTAKIDPEPYPVDALPSTVRAAVEEVQAFVKAPTAMVASSALAALSVAGQAHVDVKRAEGLVGPTGLFLLTIADSGERKSTCDGFFSKPIREFEREQAEIAKPDIKAHKADLSAWEARRAGILESIKTGAKRGVQTGESEASLRDLEANKPDPFRVPKMIRGDETPENLAYSLAREWPSAGVLSSEAGIVFGAHGMGKDSIMRNLALLNILWDGGTHSVGRRTSESFTVRGARLTVALQVQESTLQSFFERSDGLARGTGFLARFLVAWPESTQGTRFFQEPPEHWPALARFHQGIAAILGNSAPIDGDGALFPAMLAFTPDAKAAWVSFHDAIETELGNGGELCDVRDVASKTADNAARLAALFHLFEHGMGGAIGLESFEGASRIAAWHLTESRRFFGEIALPKELVDAARVDAWILNRCQSGRANAVPKNDIRQRGPIRDKSRLGDALAELESLSRIRLAKEGKATVVQVNPALLGGTP